MSNIKGYKVFNPDWACRGFQYKVGETYSHDGDIEVCKKGFHFCQKASDCFNYYRFDSNNRVAEVEAMGAVKTEGDKSVTDKIRIIREIPWEELLTIVNVGKNCTGINNTGDRNTGDWNTGYHNTGDRNTGDRNTGYWNTGDRNTGYWNSTNYSTGFFNSAQAPLYIFNKPTVLSSEEILNLRGMEVLCQNYKNSWWISSADMTEKEKAEHSEYETTGGYLKTVPFKTACQMMWDKLTAEERKAVKELPNFDAEVFREITGVDVIESEGEADE